MQGPFDYFVVFAEMRTGSNLLESNLNQFAGFECHGEAFNPHFVGYPQKSDLFGVNRATRDADPVNLLKVIRDNSQGLGGFRFFHDHDPRVLETCLSDPRCGKVILTRNPLDSYVSLKIARATGQWKLTNVKKRKDSRIKFDGNEFAEHVAQLQEFQVFLQNRLQSSGQTAFYLAYEDLNDLDVINGLGKFLGSEEKLEELNSSLKKQNPSPLSDKVSNFAQIERALSELDTFNLTRTPNFEPRRGPAVPSFVTGAHVPLMYMPIRSGPEQEVQNWMAALDGVPVETLPTRLNQKGLRQWMRRKTGHRSFTVLRHPVARAHAAFCNKILLQGPGTLSELRKNLRNFYKVPIPGGDPDEDYDRNAHREAFVAFLGFLRANLTGQTNLRIDANWATQITVLQAMSRFALPDSIIREEDMNDQLPALARHVGYAQPGEVADRPPEQPFALADIYDDEIEKLVSEVYQRDYLMFGFGKWV